ncbi:MAG: ABC transporter permease [Proteobacteria bacterium]|nr:ABC transporter permease [Pseudomonadota bacterium]
MADISRSSKTGWSFRSWYSKEGWWRKHGWELLAFPVGILLIIGLWYLVAVVGDYPAFILPDPGSVFLEMEKIVANGLLWFHVKATLIEMAGGLALGLCTAVVLGYALAKSPLMERLIGPYIVASQSIPAVAIAPLLIIWFGTGKISKVLICALVVFFPVLVNIIVGIRSVDEGLRTLMRSLHANRRQTFLMLEVPAAMPVLLGGLKIGVTLSVIGAVVGEFVGADRGLGYLINLSKGLFNTALMFAALIVLTGISLGLYLMVTGLEKWLLSWRS